MKKITMRKVRENKKSSMGDTIVSRYDEQFRIEIVSSSDSDVLEMLFDNFIDRVRILDLDVYFSGCPYTEVDNDRNVYGDYVTINKDDLDLFNSFYAEFKKTLKNKEAEILEQIEKAENLEKDIEIQSDLEMVLEESREIEIETNLEIKSNLELCLDKHLNFNNRVNDVINEIDSHNEKNKDAYNKLLSDKSLKLTDDDFYGNDEDEKEVIYKVSECIRLTNQQPYWGKIGYVKTCAGIQKVKVNDVGFRGFSYSVLFDNGGFTGVSGWTPNSYEWYYPKNKPQPEVKTLHVPACNEHNGMYSIKVKVVWECKVCGCKLPNTFKDKSYDGSRILYNMDAWDKCHSCNHVDTYEDIRKIAANNGLNEDIRELDSYRNK